MVRIETEFEELLTRARKSAALFTDQDFKYDQKKMYGESDFTTDNAGYANNGAGAMDQSAYGGGGNGYKPMGIALDPSELSKIAEVRRELDSINPETHKHTHRVLTEELERLQSRMDPEYMEIDIPKPVKVMKKVLIPAHRHPKFNFVGKLLGPGGQTLKALAKAHKCHVWILGRGSTRDRAKEDELLASGDPKHAHFSLPVHVKIETEAPPPIAYARIAGVLQDLHVYLQPVRDEIVQEQMTEMGLPFQQIPGGDRGRGMRGGRGGMPGRGMPMRGARGRGGRGATPAAAQAPVAYPGYGGYAGSAGLGAGSYEYTDFGGAEAAGAYYAAGRGRARPTPY